MASDFLKTEKPVEIKYGTLRPQVLRVLEQSKIQNDIIKALKEGFNTVPRIAEVTALETHLVLWHITAMKKYGRLAESGQDGNYPTYQLVEE